MGKVSDAEIIAVLLTNGGNKSDCARRLGVDRKTVQNRFRDPVFVDAFEDAKQARETLVNDLQRSATVKALEFAIEILDAPILSAYEPDGMRLKDKMAVSEMILRSMK